MTGPAEVVVVHSSDVHVRVERRANGSGAHDDLHLIRRVILTAREAGAHVLLLAGDTFEHNRLPESLLDRFAGLLGDAELPVVILPGNHDPLTPDSVYHRGRLDAPENVHVLGHSAGDAAVFSELDLEIWGRAHLDYADMAPLAEPRPRSTRWQIAAAHGHFIADPIEPERFYGSWIIREDQIAATGADYVALGHWNRRVRVGDGRIPAYYSGSPDYAGTVNVVRLLPDGTVRIDHRPLAADEE